MPQHGERTKENLVKNQTPLAMSIDMLRASHTEGPLGRIGSLYATPTFFSDTGEPVLAPPPGTVEGEQPPEEPPGRGTIVIEEEPPATTTPEGEQRGLAPDVAALVEKARQEEKDKLYPRLQAMEEEVSLVRKQREEAEAEERKRQEEAEAEARRKAEEEMDVRTLLTQKEQEWEKRFQESQAEIEQERAVFAMERQFQELQVYRSQAIAAAQEDLMPELVEDFIPTTLTSKEAIDAAVDRCREKSLSIVQQMQQRTNEVRQQQQGVRPTGAPPVGPMENETSQRVLTGDDIKNMSIEEYAKNRDKILQQVSERARVNGPYGV